MNSTKTKKKTNIWNRLLAITLVCLLVVFAIFLILVFRQERDLDLSEAYTPTISAAAEGSGLGSGAGNDSAGDDVSRQTSSAFASDLCVSEGTVALEGVSLQGSQEKGLLFNLETKQTLFAQGIYDQMYPASITKIMTAILAIKYGNMDDQVTITAEDLALEEGSQMSGMIEGDQVTMDQLFHALVIYSANDAAMAIARQIGGSVDHFVEMMNEEALSLGMTGTHFMNPHGLHDGNHYTTVYDVYLMLKEAYQYSQFTDAAQMSVYQLTVTHSDGSQATFRLDSTDKYLTGVKTAPKDVTLLCGKTGTTDEAGSCLAVIAQNAYGVPYMAVILHADNHTVLYEDMNTLLMQINN